MVTLILKTGFDINVRTSRGTALHEAAICGKIDVVKILLDANINVELRDQVTMQLIIFFLNGPSPASFSFIFVFSNNFTILQINVKNVHSVYGAGIRTYDLLNTSLLP